MKIKPEHYEHIKKEIQLHIPNDAWNTHRRTLIEAQNNKTQTIKNLEVRLIFDCYNACGLTRYACDVLYDYLNDDHIQTALLKIQKELFTIEANV